MAKGWYGNKMGHSLASRGIKSDIRKIDFQIESDRIEDVVGNLLGGKIYTFVYNSKDVKEIIYVKDTVVLNRLWNYLKINKEEYNITHIARDTFSDSFIMVINNDRILRLEKNKEGV